MGGGEEPSSSSPLPLSSTFSSLFAALATKEAKLKGVEDRRDDAESNLNDDGLANGFENEGHAMPPEGFYYNKASSSRREKWKETLNR